VTEGRYWSEKLRPALFKERALKDWTLWKHCDRFSSGILDFSLSLGKHTEWYELKIEPRRETALQRYYRKRLKDGAHLIIVQEDLKGYAFDKEVMRFNTSRDVIVSLTAAIVMSTYA